MITNPSESKFESLAFRIGQWAMDQSLTSKETDLIVEVINTLRAAEDALCAAGFFATAVSEPMSLRFVWSSGKQPFDPQAALTQLKDAADYVMWAVDTELFGPNSALRKPPQPPDKYFYLVNSNGAKVTIQSPCPLNVDEICRVAIRRFAQVGFIFGDVLEVSLCDEKYAALETSLVSVKDQLQKAEQRSAERRGV
jgi:hypothetical protein